MKRNLVYLLMLVCSVTLFTGCSDDDDDKVNPFGTYAGTLDVVLTTLGDEPIPFQSSESVQLIKGSSDTNFSFLLKNLILNPGADGAMPIGHINIDNIDLVLVKDGEYTFTKKISNLTIAAGDKAGIDKDGWMGPTLGVLYPAGIPVELEGTIKGNKVTVNLKIVLEDMMDIAVKFAGTK
ncbi:calycin-like domain-containing protein [Bacteroides reticulotermitis]|uniref:calycin-like domain-containing protein n=1 Tax=Bacteroides reticulotermitis TaxID=1133319 RepID=UPI003A8447B8